MAVKVQTQRFDTGAEIEALVADRRHIGAVTSFTGYVRDFSSESGVIAMTLEHYPGMTERMLEKIEAEARERWDLVDALIIHRYGRMTVGEPIVLVVTASSHRQAAFESCAFLMDWLKTKAPFWKCEEKADGAKIWVDARESDDAAAARWGASS
ncbi:MAG TPA: molybdenum cofactor biosynthesis protein MoaE [Alphaproteobacteria bacterium]|nr:molybdenum cofactor biosynthesis protein MoaE [Alphaproteobacteria bacterium]